jgi:hypothetical protein
LKTTSMEIIAAARAGEEVLRLGFGHEAEVA